MSRQLMRYQKLNMPVWPGTVNVCLMVLSPLVGEDAPTLAEYLPAWAIVLIEVVPVVFQPVKSPLSKSPLLMPRLADVTITDMDV